MTCEHINEGKNKFFTNLQTDMVWSFNSEYATFYKKKSSRICIAFTPSPLRLFQPIHI